MSEILQPALKNFLSSYSIDEKLDYLPENNYAPTIYSAFDISSEENVLIKVWPRRKGLDNDLLSLWDTELRQMQRFDGLAGVREYLITIQGAGIDDDGFYLVLGPGELRPIAWHQRNAKNRKTLATKNSTRKLLWTNFHRIAKGLGILHSQGLLHRNVSESSVFTENGSVPDYRLGGFEWNIRLNSIDDRSVPTMYNSDISSRASFQHDWMAFAHLALRMLEVPIEDLSLIHISEPTRPY